MGREKWGERNGAREMGREKWGERNGAREMGREKWGERNGKWEEVTERLRAENEFDLFLILFSKHRITLFDFQVIE
jgi:hypothetical protein